MGISISAVDLSGPFPRASRVTLSCDMEMPLGKSSGILYCGHSEDFEHPDGYVGAHAEAMRNGWLERQGTNGRLWLCPQCSGKKT